MDKLKKIFKKDDNSSSSTSSSSPYQQQQQPPAQQQQTQSTPQTQQPPVSGSETKNQIDPSQAEGVIMTTTLGDITIALFKDQTPNTCLNFATLAATGRYNSVPFHRIIPSFMIQGGDPTGTGRGGSSIWGKPFADEIVPSLKHTDKGTLSMANSGPDTNGSQFFITLAATPHLDGKHAVFGHVVQGMEVVERLGAVRTGQGDKPLQEVKIVGCTIF